MINVQGLETIFVTGKMDEMESISEVLKSLGFTQIKDRPNAYEFNTGINAPAEHVFDADRSVLWGCQYPEKQQIK